MRIEMSSLKSQKSPPPLSLFHPNPVLTLCSRAGTLLTPLCEFFISKSKSQSTLILTPSDIFPFLHILCLCCNYRLFKEVRAFVIKFSLTPRQLKDVQTWVQIWKKEMALGFFNCFCIVIRHFSWPHVSVWMNVDCGSIKGKKAF